MQNANGVEVGEPVITIRAMEAGDVPEISRLCDALGYPATSDAVARRSSILTCSTGDVLFVAIDRGVVVGWAHAFLSVLLETDPFVEIGGIVVAEAARRRGVGRLLMSAAERWAVSRGCVEVRLRSNVVREGAHRFYELLGYQRLKTQYTFTKRVNLSERSSTRLGGDPFRS
jgi:GNAT superfamily N-acetyltransferase